MKIKLNKKFKVIIPEWQYYYVKSHKTAAKYWEWKDRNKLPKKYKEIVKSAPVIHGKKAYCCDEENNRFLRNSVKAGKPNTWVLNGQSLYNATLNWRLRKKVTGYYHDYFSTYIKEQLSPIALAEGERFSISCDIYEIKRVPMPDVSNMWLLEKYFEDSLIECGIIIDDSPDYVIESGRKKYHWVVEPKERKLIFNIEIVKI